MHRPGSATRASGSIETDALQAKLRWRNELLLSLPADLEEFGRVGFEIAPFETSGGTQRREVATLNERMEHLVVRGLTMRIKELSGAVMSTLSDDVVETCELSATVGCTLDEELAL